jgi:hypothetical protein
VPIQGFEGSLRPTRPAGRQEHPLSEQSGWDVHRRSEKAGIWKTPGTYSLGVLVSDFDNDGWPDIYVANDSSSSALYHNNGDGTFREIAIEAGVAFSADGKTQAGMGVAAADYDGDGRFDIVENQLRR